MKAILIGLMLVVLLVPIVGAEIDYTYRCSGDILIKEANFSINTDVYQLNQTVTCPYGCDTNTRACRPSPTQGYIYVGIFVIAILVIGGLIYRH